MHAETVEHFRIHVQPITNQTRRISVNEIRSVLFILSLLSFFIKFDNVLSMCSLMHYRKHNYDLIDQECYDGVVTTKQNTAISAASNR